MPATCHGWIPETGQGLVTDVCLKRKVRNYVGLVKEEQPPYEIYVKEKAVLNSQHQRAYEELKLKPEKKEAAKERRGRAAVDGVDVCQLLRHPRFRRRDDHGGQLRTGAGPSSAGHCPQRRTDRVAGAAVTRCAVTHEKDLEKERTIGRKFSVPYGLYRAHGFINPHLGAQTGFDENGEDLALFWTSLAQMFETDRSAARGEMAPQALIVFQHESPLGNAPANKLFERVRTPRQSTDGADWRPARTFGDYVVEVDESDLPSGVSVTRRF